MGVLGQIHRLDYSAENPAAMRRLVWPNCETATNLGFILLHCRIVNFYLLEKKCPFYPHKNTEKYNYVYKKDLICFDFPKKKEFTIKEILFLITLVFNKDRSAIDASHRVNFTFIFF